MPSEGIARALDAGIRNLNGTLRTVHLDDRGHTDRYVLGARAAAEQVAAAVVHFRLTTLGHVTAGAEQLGVPVGELGHHLRRLRSSRAAGGATADAHLDALTRLAVRMNDLRLWRS